jgi:hypothetical protein
MTASARRRLTLFDLLVLIAATSLGLALFRISRSGIAARPVAAYAGALAASYITVAQTYASCFLTPWSAAILALSLRQPRASFRRVAQGPGFIACATATVGAVLFTTLSVAQYAVGRQSFDPANASRIISALGSYTSLMVAGGWMALGLASAWRAETSWIGWAGRLLGVSWIGLFLIGWLRAFV